MTLLVWYEKHVEGTTTTLNKVTDTDHKEWWDKGGEAQQTDWSYFKAEYNTYPLTITKTVTGSMGDKTKPFDINYSIHTNENYEKDLPLTYSETGATGSKGPLTNKGDTLKVSGTTANDSSETVSNYLAKLAHGQSVTIHGLAAVDTVKVWETFTKKESGKDVPDANADGYKVSYTKTVKDAATNVETTADINKGLPINGTKDDTHITEIGGSDDSLINNHKVTVTNKKDGGPITGIVHNYGPFALMAAVGAALIGFFFRRRREE